MRFKKKFEFIQQTGMTECGSTCLAMIFKFYGYFNIQSLLAKLGDVTTEGTNLYNLAQLAEQFGFKSDGYELFSYNHLKEVTLPCIAHFNGDHFIVVYKYTDDYVLVADPAYGLDKLAKKEFETKWNGIILVVEPTAEVFKNKDLAESVDDYMKQRKTVFKKFYAPVINALKPVIKEILLATLLLQLLGLAVPFFTQTIIDNVLVNQNAKLLVGILIGMTAIFLIQTVLLYVRNILLIHLQINFELDFFSRFFRHFISLKQKYYDNTKREDFMARFQENVTIRQLVNPTVIESIVDVLFIMLYIPVLLFYNVKLGLAAVFFVVLFFVFTLYYTPIMRLLVYKVFYKNLETLGAFLDSLLGIKTVKLLSIENFKFWQWKNKYKKTLNTVLESEKKNIWLHTLQRSMFFLSQITVFWIGAYMTFKNEITIGQYIAFTSIFLVVMGSLNSLTMIWYNVTELWVSLGRLNDVLLQETENTSMIELVNSFSANTLQAKNLSFRYNKSDEEFVLENLNFEIKKGEHIGVVGRNGTGKTTLVKLLVNLYSDYEGEIFLDDHEIRILNPIALRSKVFLYPQDIFIFAGTIKENILCANNSASIDDVIRAAQMADLHDFVKSLYLGYNHKVGDTGANLSGGQKLKIGFARLFIANPDIIILDEASSMLDLESERLIMMNLKEHFKGKTIISIAHRIHTLKNADRILVLDNKTIAEAGHHNELMEKKGIYHKFISTYVEY